MIITKRLLLGLLVICLISCKTAENSNKKDVNFQADPYANNNSCRDKPSNYCWYLARNSVKEAPDLAVKLFAYACNKGYSQACLEGAFYFQNSWFQKKSCLHENKHACEGKKVDLISDEERYKSFKSGHGGMAPPPTNDEINDLVKSLTRVIKTKDNDIRYCYEREITHNPDAKGKIRVGFELNESNRFKYIEVNGEGFSDEFKYCFVNAIASIRFSKNASYKRVYKSYVFSHD